MLEAEFTDRLIEANKQLDSGETPKASCVQKIGALVVHFDSPVAASLAMTGVFMAVARKGGGEAVADALINIAASTSKTQTVVLAIAAATTMIAENANAPYVRKLSSFFQRLRGDDRYLEAAKNPKLADPVARPVITALNRMRVTTKAAQAA